MKTFLLICMTTLSGLLQAQEQTFEVYDGIFDINPGKIEVFPEKVLYYENIFDLTPVKIIPDNNGAAIIYNDFSTLNGRITIDEKGSFDHFFTFFTQQECAENNTTKIKIFRDIFDANPAVLEKQNNNAKLYRNNFDLNPMIIEKTDDGGFKIYMDVFDTNPLIISPDNSYLMRGILIMNKNVPATIAK